MIGTRAAAAACYELHGYTVCVEGFPDLAGLPALRRTEAPSGDDVVAVRAGARRAVPAGAAAGVVVARLTDDDGRPFYTFSRTADRLVLRWHGVLDAVADPGLRAVRVHLDPEADPGIVPVLLPGTVMAVRLMLDGRLALHASAVADRGTVVAFAGPSGGGKSTLAGLGILAGLPLVTDDVLRVDVGAEAVRSWPGATSVRLRPGLARLARTMMGEAVPLTADGRFSVPAPRVAPRSLPLRCIVLARLVRGGDGPVVERLAPDAALRRLVAAPRVLGWSGPAELSRQFLQLADLCERVPVLEAAVPGRRRNDPAVVLDVLAAADGLTG